MTLALLLLQAAYDIERNNRVASPLQPTRSFGVHKAIEPTILYFGTPVALISCRFFGLTDEVHPSQLAQSKFMKDVHPPAPRARVTAA